MKRQKICILPRLNDYNGDISKQWFVYYSYRNPKSGKMVRFRTSDGFSTLPSAAMRRKIAMKLINKLTYKLRNNWNPFADDEKIIYSDNLKYDLLAKTTGRLRKNNKTINYYLNEFMNIKKPNLRISTYHTYKSKFRILDKFLIENKINDNDITEFTEETAQKFINYLFDKRKVSNNMVNHYLLAINMFFKNLIKRNIIQVNPFARIEYYKITPLPAKYFQMQTLELVKEAFLKYDPQMWTIAQFEFYCMLRPIELRKLQLKNIDMFEATITVPAHIAKNGIQRTVVIPEPLHNYLRNIINIQQYPENFFIISKKKQPDAEPVGKNYMWNHFEKIRKLINLPRDYKLYSFKHTGNVMAVKAGIGLKELQMQNGHASLDQLNAYLRQMIGTESEALRNRGPVI